MSIGPFQQLPGSHEMSGAMTIPNEPWLLPISDDAHVGHKVAPESLEEAVRRASRPFWIAANGLCVALGLLLTLQATTGFIAPAQRSVGPVAQSGPPTIPAQTAAFTGHH